jgi:HPt (histidine-containing phosphotransfer) domain-containing protein
MRETPPLPSSPESFSDGQIVDFSYIEELSGGKQEFINQVLTIFMDNTPPGLKELEALVSSGKKWEAISKQSHFLKSSVGIVKVRGVHELLQKIETLAKEKRNMDEIKAYLEEVVNTFAKAEPIIKRRIESTATS